jgi:ketosteroid isomerase-like protein
MNAQQQNTQLVQDSYGAFARGDVQKILNSLTADVEWIFDAPSTIPYSGRRKGEAEVLGFFQGLAETQENMQLTMDTFIAEGDGVAALGRYSATVKATGKKLDVATAHFFTIRGGQIARFVNLCDTAAVAEAYASATQHASR